MCDLFFFFLLLLSFSFSLPFVLRACLSGCAHGAHANGKELAVALFQRRSETHWEKKRLTRGEVDEGRKMELKMEGLFFYYFHLLII